MLGDNILNTGVGGSIFGGAKFNKNFGLDLEAGLLGGGTVFDDVDYSVFAVFLNSRIILPLSSENDKTAIFLSPGIGFSRASIDGSINGQSVDISDDTRFSLQGKVGFNYKTSKNGNLFLQLRYAAQVADEDTVSFFLPEIGFMFDF